jgi:hypothetical protein
LSSGDDDDVDAPVEAACLLGGVVGDGVVFGISGGGEASRTTSLSPVTSVITVSGFCSTNLSSSALTTMGCPLSRESSIIAWPALSGEVIGVRGRNLS